MEWKHRIKNKLENKLEISFKQNLKQKTSVKNCQFTIENILVNQWDKC